MAFRQQHLIADSNSLKPRHLKKRTNIEIETEKAPNFSVDTEPERRFVPMPRQESSWGGYALLPPGSRGSAVWSGARYQMGEQTARGDASWRHSNIRMQNDDGVGRIDLSAINDATA
jgi:hypothetical protein